MSVIPDPATTKWVPLQGNIAERMEYWGAYSASKTYNDGDCAIGTDGILYMCVKNGTVGSAPAKWPGAGIPQGAIGPQGPAGVGIPTPVVNGQWIKGSGGAAVWSALSLADIPNAAAKPGYGTTLPASPTDGQEYILVDSLTAPTRSWRCRYNAQTSNPYKWEVHSASPLLGISQAQTTIGAVTTWVNIVGSAITIPREGTYSCTASCRVNNGAGAQHIYMMFWAASQGNVFGPQALVGLNSGWWGVLSISPFLYAGFGVNTTIGLSCYINAATPCYAGEISWSVTPIRLL
jgi:hypothetical protein